MAYRSLPWIGLTDSEIKEKKAASDEFVRHCPVYSRFLTILSSLIVRIALDSPLFRRLALRSGSCEGRRRIHRRERFYLAGHAGRSFFIPFRSFLDRHAQNQEEKHASAGILTSRAHPAPAEGAGPRGSAVLFVGGGRSSEGSKGSDSARADGGGSEIRGESGERKATDGTDRQPAAAAKAAETPAREREKRGRERGNGEGVDGMQ